MSISFACLYLHGFLSSPQSQKARELETYFRTHFNADQLSIPFLDFEPAIAIAQARAELKRLQQQFERVFIIGSSLGGFYATHLSVTEQVPAILINPAVRPFALFTHYLGPHKHFYTDAVHELTQTHIEQLAALDCPQIHNPQRIFLLLQTGDETLDYRHAASLYKDCPSWLEGGGTHRFEQFIERMPMLLNWVHAQR